MSKSHKCAVVNLSIDKPGNYFASCANDFSVLIVGIGCNDYNQVRLFLFYNLSR